MNILAPGRPYEAYTNLVCWVTQSKIGLNSAGSYVMKRGEKNTIKSVRHNYSNSYVTSVTLIELEVRLGTGALSRVFLVDDFNYKNFSNSIFFGDRYGSKRSASRVYFRDNSGTIREAVDIYVGDRSGIPRKAI